MLATTCASVSEIAERMLRSAKLDAMAQEDVNQLPVLDHGEFLGVVSRDQMLRLIAVRTELAM